MHGVNFRIDLLADDSGPYLVAGFAVRAERDRYLAEWKPEEVTRLHSITTELHKLPLGMGRAPLVRKIEQLKDSVQKRTGIKDS